MATVALESTVIAHGLPYPDNIYTALALEQIVREEGGDPRTIGIIDGEIIVGMTPEQIDRLGSTSDVRKVSRRDLPIVMGRKLTGATTVSATMWIAERFGIEVFATGGIGGVHRGAGTSFDISADLPELGRTSVTVVCAGVKSILDIAATLEVLETYGVTVIGFETDDFPAFYSRSSGHPVDIRCDTAGEVASIVRARRNLGLAGGLLVGVPVPAAAEIPRAEIDPVIERALNELHERALTSAAVTPFLLSRLGEMTGHRSLEANIALLKNNARVAARIALALGHA